MPVPYNLTTILTRSNQTGLVKFINGTSSIVDTSTNMQGSVGLVILLIVFIVFFISVKARGYTPYASFATASWITVIVALLIQPMGLLSSTVFYTSLVLLPLTIIMLFWFQSSD